MFLKKFNLHTCYPNDYWNIFYIPWSWKQSLMEQINFSEPAPGWKTHTVPWLNFVSQVSSILITRGMGNWYAKYFLSVSKEPYLQLGFFGSKGKKLLVQIMWMKDDWNHWHINLIFSGWFYFLLLHLILVNLWHWINFRI